MKSVALGLIPTDCHLLFSNELQTDFKMHKIIKNLKFRLFLKPFSYEIMTNFITHIYCFLILRRPLVVNEYMEIQLILFEDFNLSDHMCI